jgi:hypothetical protein
VAAFWTSQAAMGVSCSWVARPNLFTICFVLLTARVCVLFHEGRCTRRQTLWLVPLFALWANMHGGFLAGFLILGATFLLETSVAVFGASREGRQAAWRRAGHWSLLLGGAFLASLLNPYGLSLYRWLLQLLGDSFFMNLHQEWKTPDFHGKGAIRFELLMLLFPLVLAVSKRRPHLVEVGLAIFWFHFALTSFRYVPLWVVIVTPLLARASLHIPWLQQLSRRFLAAEEGNRLFLVHPRPAPWAWSVLGALALLGVAWCVEGRLAKHQPEIIPAHALDRFLHIQEERRLQYGCRPIVFHSYDWGGYLTWHGGPHFRNWIDDRNEVQGREHIENYFAILRTDAGWNVKLAQAGVQLICIQPNAPLAFRLSERADWRERYRDDWAVIFERIPRQEAGR